jgi:hypothetical protein
MKNSWLGYYIFFCFFCLPVFSNAAELDVRLSGETGLYQAKSSTQNSSADFISRFSGWLKLQESTPTSGWNLSLQLKPEFYLGNFGYSALKFISKGQFHQKKKSLQLGMGFDARKYSYFSLSRNSTFDFFKFEGFLSTLIHRKLNLTLSPSYYYRDLSTQKLDAFSGELSLNALPANNLNMGLGTYLENFRLSADLYPVFSANRQTNDGWRWGPELTFVYLKKVYFNLRYIFLWHQSEITVSPSFEQYLRLFISRKIIKEWIIFFVIDYFWNDIGLQADQNGALLYIPFENENHIDLKLEKLIEQNLFLSARIGYFKDNYILPEFSLEGWQVLIGLEFEY